MLERDVTARPGAQIQFFIRDGCEVERKWKKGEYESKVKCKPGRYGYGY